jgi:hypothetical protein
MTSSLLMKVELRRQMPARLMLDGLMWSQVAMLSRQQIILSATVHCVESTGLSVRSLCH